MSDPFRFMKSIQVTKEPIMNSSEDEKDYVPFLMNRGLSQYIDSILYANEMNQNHHLDKRMQYDYYMQSIRKMSRKFVKWAKRADAEVLEAIQEYYQCNRKRALEALQIIKPSDIEFIVNLMKKEDK